MILPFPSLLLGFKCWKQHTCKLKLLSSPIPTLTSNVKLLSAKLFKRRNKVLVLGQYKKKRCPWNQWFRTFYTKSQPFNTSHYEKDFLFYFTFKWSCAVWCRGHTHVTASRPHPRWRWPPWTASSAGPTSCLSSPRIRLSEWEITFSILTSMCTISELDLNICQNWRTLMII